MVVSVDEFHEEYVHDAESLSFILQLSFTLAPSATTELLGIVEKDITESDKITETQINILQ